MRRVGSSSTTASSSISSSSSSSSSRSIIWSRRRTFVLAALLSTALFSACVTVRLQQQSSTDDADTKDLFLADQLRSEARRLRDEVAEERRRKEEMVKEEEDASKEKEESVNDRKSTSQQPEVPPEPPPPSSPPPSPSPSPSPPPHSPPPHQTHPTQQQQTHPNQQGGGWGELDAEEEALWSRVLPPAPASLTVVFGSIAMLDFITNWVLHVQRIPALHDYVVITMDDELLAHCRQRGFPAIPAINAEIIGHMGKGGSVAGSDLKTNKKYYRTDLNAFKKMGAVKADFLRMLLVKGYDVLVSDADTVWFTDPWPLLGKHPNTNTNNKDNPSPSPIRLPAARLFADADILVTSDCIDATKDIVPELVTWEINTGVLFVRSTPRSIEFCEEWRERALSTTDGHDQSEFNRILKGGYTKGVPCNGAKCLSPFYDWPYLPVEIASNDGVDPLSPNETLRASYYVDRGVRSALVDHIHASFAVGILPLTEFLGGHTYFVQRIPSRYSVSPINVHATYQFGDTPEYMFGKRQRMREHGLWLYEDDEPGELPSSFSPTLGCFHPSRLVTTVPKDSRANLRSAVDPAKPHLDVVRRLRLVLRNAVTLARTLGRAIVLPQFWCVAERHWWMLEDGRVPGGQVQLPFECPMDNLVEPALWVNHIDFRQAKFLSDPRIPESVSSSRSVLELVPRGELGSRDMVIEKDVIRVPAGIRYDEAKEMLSKEGVKRTRVLSISATDVMKFSLCAFKNRSSVRYANEVIETAFKLQFIKEVADQAFARGEDLGAAFRREFNCTGEVHTQQPVDLGPPKLLYCEEADGLGGVSS
eukprot:jgi/Chlat1/8627/Chrsp86S08010